MINPETIDGVDYYTVAQLSIITNKTTQAIYKLIHYGNSIRHMRRITMFGRMLIPATELTDFPFTGMGRNAHLTIYHYNKEGEQIEEVNSNPTPKLENVPNS